VERYISDWSNFDRFFISWSKKKQRQRTYIVLFPIQIKYKMSFKEEIDEEEINAAFGGAPLPSCCHAIMTNPMMKFALMVPLGGVISFLLSIIGMSFFNAGLGDINDMLKTAKMDLGEEFDLISTFAQLFFVVNLLVCIYGFREKFRVRWNRCAHHDVGCGLCWCFKLAIVKPLFTLILTLFLFVAFICLAVFLALYMTLWTIDQTCASSEVFIVSPHALTQFISPSCLKSVEK
jgi:hypothetical protein